MSRYLKKITAFTLNEVMVALLITTIVVGMAFSVLRLVQQQMYGISVNFERNTQVDLLRQGLWMDFNRFDRVRFDAPRQQLLFVNEVETRTYHFYDGLVVRDRDTFHIKIMEKSRYFNGEARFSGEIDALDLHTAKEHGGHRIFVFKRNAATSYLNRQDGI
ncbi:PulJ/GspJ family protein [Flagellimonas meishanensis]|uniref:PulJ/GspJ family protein n=1 Tax=Flagellimonas meishanensis TaxID=2873264 RepID=UPI001CA6CADC|nr:hypothetical protein [[Muricauda] meishanensis]